MTDPRTRPPVLVLGLGNSLLTDDGVGLELLRRIEGTSVGSDPRFELVDGGTQGVALVGLFEDRRGVLLLDAEQRGAAPGTVHASDTAGLASGARGITAHEGNASELLAVVRLLEACSAPILLLGVEPHEIRTGYGLTPDVERALPQALRSAQELLRELADRIPLSPEATSCTS